MDLARGQVPRLCQADLVRVLGLHDMSWRTSTVTIAVRNAGRALGLNRVIAGIAGRRSYEDRFHSAMLAAVGAGDCVWDVGANVGLYTDLFAKRVGPEGFVYAFEPSPSNRTRLLVAMQGYTNVIVLPLALGDRDATAVLQQGTDSLGATSRITDDSGRSGSGIVVESARGDSLVAEGKTRMPNVIKIDTEGYEVEVLAGLNKTISDQAVRALCIEVHFGLLAQRGMRAAPAGIEKTLRLHGFRYVWPDASHIVATRAD